MVTHKGKMTKTAKKLEELRVRASEQKADGTLATLLPSEVLEYLLARLGGAELSATINLRQTCKILESLNDSITRLTKMMEAKREERRKRHSTRTRTPPRTTHATHQTGPHSRAKLNSRRDAIRVAKATWTKGSMGVSEKGYPFLTTSDSTLEDGAEVRPRRAARPRRHSPPAPAAGRARRARERQVITVETDDNAPFPGNRMLFTAKNLERSRRLPVTASTASDGPMPKLQARTLNDPAYMQSVMIVLAAMAQQQA